MRHLTAGPPGWDVPILETVASEGSGVKELWQASRRHWEYLRASGELATRRGLRAEREVLELVERALAVDLRTKLGAQAGLGQILEQAKTQAVDPHSAAGAILDQLLTRP
jgi:LAO/AO transport system kinase